MKPILKGDSPTSVLKESDFHKLILNRKCALNASLHEPQMTFNMGVIPHVDSSLMMISKAKGKICISQRGVTIKKNRSCERALSLSINQVNDYERILALGGTKNENWRIDNSIIEKNKTLKKSTSEENFSIDTKRYGRLAGRYRIGTGKGGNDEENDEEKVFLKQKFYDIKGSLTRCNNLRMKETISTPMIRKKREKKDHRRVSFSTVEVRRYEQILGDNPGVSSGPSLSIGWNYDPNQTENYDLSSSRRYEIDSFSKKSVRLLSRDDRIKVLFNLGYSAQDVKASIREINQIKQCRQHTILSLQKSNKKEVVQDARSTLMNMFYQRSYVSRSA